MGINYDIYFQIIYLMVLNHNHHPLKILLNDFKNVPILIHKSTIIKINPLFMKLFIKQINNNSSIHYITFLINFHNDFHKQILEN